MPADLQFTNLLTTAQRGWMDLDGEDGLLSLALPLNGVDPLHAL